MQPLPVYILAGGMSSRFGSDKARATVEDVTLIERVSKLVAGHASRVTVVAREADAYADMGLRTIGDVTPGRGPLGGLVTAIADLKAHDDGRWLLLCSCDVVVMNAPWLTQLIEATTQPADDQGREVQAVAFKGEYWQPLPGVYDVTIEQVVKQEASGEKRSMQGLLEQINAKAIAMPADWPELWQVNRKDDLERFRQGQA